MKTILQLFIAIGLWFAPFNANASDQAFSDVQQYFAQTSDSKVTLTVKYYAHNGPTIEEYLSGKARVDAILRKMIDFGLQPKRKYIDVFIAPREMIGGEAFIENGLTYISVTASDLIIEGVLIDHFEYSVEHGGIYYFSHLNATIEQIEIGKATFERVLAKFKAAGLNLKMPNQVGISSIKMVGGEIVLKDNRIFCFFDASEETIERFLMQFMRE